MEQARVLVFSNDREFVEAMARSWRRLLYSPEFMVARTTGSGEPLRSAVVVTSEVSVLPHLAAGVVLAIVVIPDVVIPDAAPPALDGLETDGADRSGGMRVLWIQRSPGWSDVAAALAQETVLRLEAQGQTAEVMQRLREAEHFAALGRFIAEARHGLGNALTGVLGHSELLLLEAGKGLEGETRAQVETIHAMSLKIHETLRRLSSLDLELGMAERQAEQRETQCRPVQ